MTGHMCPECGGEREARPGAGCVCGDRAASGEARRAARSAETAAAEDFDPLRIRPYVTLHSDDAHTHDDADTAALPVLPEEAPAPAPHPVPGPLPDAVAADGSRRRSAAAYAGDGPDPVQPRRRRPFAVVAVGAAVAAVVGTAAFAGGLFDDRGGDDAALPEVTAEVQDASEAPAVSVSESPSASPSATASRSASASASPSASPTPSQSPSASRSAAAPTTAPPPSASATSAPPTLAAPPPAQAPDGTLRPGDTGAEVGELQRRLQEIWVYRGPDDGRYSDRVEQAVAEFQRWMSVRNDPSGVYGPETRQALESRTTGQGRHS
ncbi:peptidoglycan-binding protein [Streptomyces sp. NBC_00178]|uniref:peptidoglycan-binding domain-containing protein n=1 Tax=Streptomyces sp. NBC_00178 TaxID=2975672 RepID=UPI002E27C1E4|nr:peptidoglycan-binding domain-containing protein [Streptomyces sp. NBC_00178]